MSKDIEKRVFTTSFEVRTDENGESNQIAGYAALYDSQSEDLGFFERIAPGAFEGADISDVRALIDHESGKILGRTTAGTLRVVADERGLSYEVDLPNTTYANDLKVSMDRRDITQSSFAFSDTDDEWEDRAGKWYRTITKIRKVHDVSPVTYPAYTDTSVALRGLEQVKAEKPKPEPTEKENDNEILNHRWKQYSGLT